MYAAGGVRSKANASEARRITTNNAVRSSTSAVREATRAAYSITNTGGTNSSNNLNATTPTLKSKYTARHMTPTRATTAKMKTKVSTNSATDRSASRPTTTTTSTTKNKSLTGLQSLRKDTIATRERKKAPPNSQAIPLPAQAKQSPAAIIRLSQPKRIWNSNLGNENNTTSKLKSKAEDEQLAKSTAELENEPIVCHEVGVQTYEHEILNYDMLVGDNKFILPSKELVQAIERKREEELRQKLLKSERKFEEHSEHFGEHVSNLKEFLETGKITRRKRVEKTAPDFRMDRRIIRQMDEFLKRRIPKTESMTNIKERIHKKEKELLNLFDNVENIQI